MQSALALRFDGLHARGGWPGRRPQSDCDFLAGTLVDSATLARAEALAARWGVAPAEVLIAAGWITPDAYARALAQHHGLSYWQGPISDRAAPLSGYANLRDALAEGTLREFGTHGAALYAPEPSRPHDLHRVHHQFGGKQLALVSPREMRSAICRAYVPHLMRGAVEGLRARTPEQSARSRFAPWQLAAICAALATLLAALVLDPLGAVRFVSYLLVVLFVPVIAIRLLALCDLARGQRSRRDRPQPRIPDQYLPVYTVLVALYREAKVLPVLVDGLTKLDYPAFGSKSTKELLGLNGDVAWAA